MPLYIHYDSSMLTELIMTSHLVGPYQVGHLRTHKQDIVVNVME